MARCCGLFMVAALLLACGATTVELSRDEFDRLPRDAQQDVFDAENDLVIAHNREDEARERLRRLDRQLDDLENAWKRTEKRLTAANQATRLSSARKAMEAHRALIKAEADVADASIEVAVIETELSRSRLRLVRQRQLARIGRVPVASLGDFEKRVSNDEKRVKSARSRDLDLRARAQNQLTAWKNAEDEYGRTTGDQDTGIWID